MTRRTRLKTPSKKSLTMDNPNYEALYLAAKELLGCVPIGPPFNNVYLAGFDEKMKKLKTLEMNEGAALESDGPFPMYEIEIIESERGWGQKTDEYVYFPYEDEAKSYVKDYNSKNTDAVTPDWYMYAANPRLVLVSRDHYYSIKKSCAVTHMAKSISINK